MKRRVKLTADLTKYDRRLVVGSLGWTDPTARAEYGVMVKYDNGAYLDTLWRSLEELAEETEAASLREQLAAFNTQVVQLLDKGVEPKSLRQRVTGLIDKHRLDTKRQQRVRAKTQEKAHA